MMRAKWILALSLGLLGFAQAEDSSNEGWSVGAPHFEFFTRSQSTTTKLPGYFIGFANHTRTFSSKFDSLGGNISASESSFFAPLLPLNNGDWHVLALFLYTQTSFDSSIPDILTQDALHSYNFPIAVVKEINHDWLLGGLVMPSLNGDFKAGSNEAVAMAFGAGKVMSPDFRLMGGFYYSHYYGNDTFFPGIQLIYRPFTDVEAYILGPIAGVSYSINDDWFMGLSARLSSATWKVESNEVLPEHVINMKKVNIALRTEHRLYKNLWLSVDAGYSVARRIKIEDIPNNQTLGRSHILPGPFASIGVNYRY